MKLYNTLTRRLQELQPLKPAEISLYTCGPTVYDYAHIGNLRTYITEDLLRRALRVSGYKVKHVMNLTDVDDKTIGRSQTKYPDISPLEALIKLTRLYESQFLQDIASLNIDLSSSQIVRATEHIESMQQLITKIYQAGWAYIAEDGIYFNLSSYIASGHEYGQLSNIDFKPQPRINNDDYDKHSAADFALWKRAQPNEPSWDFELDDQSIAGRPGWHIECSAMSTQYLGQPFDLHTGGIDLAFPHHENEIAQSAVNNRTMAAYFLHSNHLLVDGTKMSKRLKNFYTLKDITNRGYHPLAFRLRCLQAHYRSELNFTWGSLDAAQNLLTNLTAWADLRHQPSLWPPITPADVIRLTSEIKAALSDNLDSPRALAAISQFADQPKAPTMELLEQIDFTLGTKLATHPDVADPQKTKIKLREAARQNQDFKTSDDLRNQLLEEGIALEDTLTGPRWRRTKL